MEEVILVYVNCASRADARHIGTSLIEGQLAACVNLIVGVESIYRWEGKVCKESEVMMVIKTTLEKYADLQAKVRELHSYDTPEIIYQKVDGGDARYLAWVAGQVNLKHS